MVAALSVRVKFAPNAKLRRRALSRAAVTGRYRLLQAVTGRYSPLQAVHGGYETRGRHAYPPS